LVLGLTHKVLEEFNFMTPTLDEAQIELYQTFKNSSSQKK
jgi:hypothetical protein